MTISQVAYEIESLNIKIRRIIVEEGHFTEADYPFTIKPNFSTLGSFIQISRQKSKFTFLPGDSIRDILGFNASTIYEEYTLSPTSVDISLFDNIFLETDIAQGRKFKSKRSGYLVFLQ